MEVQMKETTIKDVLIDIHRILCGIMVPVREVESIGIPIAKSINGLQLCIDTFMKQEMEQAKADELAKEQEEENTDA